MNGLERSTCCNDSIQFWILVLLSTSSLVSDSSFSLVSGSRNESTISDLVLHLNVHVHRSKSELDLDYLEILTTVSLLFFSWRFSSSGRGRGITFGS